MAVLPRRIAISAEGELNPERLARWALHAQGRGAEALVLRERGSAPEFSHFADRIRAIAKELSLPLIANPSFSVDAASAMVLLSRFQGLHLKSGLERPHLPPEIRSRSWLGRSCHTRADLETAEQEGMDYVFLSPVLPTPTHPGRPVLGIEGLSQLCAATPLPVFALGGITPEDLPMCRAAGAYGVAAIRSFSLP